ncbi:MAG: thioesterase family protein [Acidobacteriota bacterium]
MHGYPLVVPIQVRWRDLDPLDHVNNAVFVTYLEYARIRAWQRFLEYSRGSDVPFVVARIAIDYRRPIRLTDEVEVGVRTARVGRRSFTYEYRIEASGELAAEAESVQVLVDHASGRTIEVPPEMRRALEEMRGDQD